VPGWSGRPAVRRRVRGRPPGEGSAGGQRPELVGV
jgi:hypothetical protein